MKYRSYDGSCNNLQYPSRGTTLTQLVRLLRPAYEDDLNEPIGWDTKKLVRPPARLVSQNIVSTLSIVDDGSFSHMLMQWGQFIDHDISLIVGSSSRSTYKSRIPCDKLCRNDPPCFPIYPAPNDKRVPKDACIEFTRSSAACGTGLSSIFFNELLPRQQLNQVTSYIDGSTIYGSSKEEVRRLRDLDHDEGLLKEGIKISPRKRLLPFHNGAPVDCQIDDQDQSVPCFLAGDIRVNEQLALTAMHTIWMREHNRIASKLKKLNYNWNGEKIFQEARKIVIAEIQHITFHNFLPKILGQEGLKLLGKYQNYQPDADATLINSFATAAFRFGHGTVRPTLFRLNELYQPIPQGHLRLRDAFFAPSRLLHEGSIDPILRGLIFFPSKLSRSDRMLNEELTDHLFGMAHEIALDLASLNIQRGRDHGLPSYNHYRVMCNLPAATHFHELSNEITNRTILNKLEKAYQHPNNIDLWVGAMAEDALFGGRVGPTFACLIALQFNRLRAGDRFWYENKAQFSPNQLTQIKRSSLARILCDNGDNITRVQNDVFLNVYYEGDITDCDAIPSIDLKHWYECQDGKQKKKF
ncbi:uncharacterized protein TRIADDRAFT_27445 [Trichoplax adhaerens]|uniref:Thyroid peroxidase n=1 Tax=Trichoplax adhaerens TaxID=10228 RepID=B3S2M4_TRIAD|nr:hypothetical protein TRIADDRAFT_27445 [Trichoplax adhaerens]EDV23444.1 hypothetical protein TRIADDRAFT_27445 [Trichoplax adhaerens]|eukprot:XP_002114354.1 hypothetical protein TRIADDRAFT_27445 [Trichoplax adhaerens]